MVDALLSVVARKLQDALSNECRFVTELRDQFETLQTEILFMQTFVKAAERKKRKNSDLRAIMVMFRDLLYEAEDILADCQLYAGGKNGPLPKSWRACMQPSKLPFHYHTGRRLREINEKITKIKNTLLSYPELKFLERTDSAKDINPRWSTELYDQGQVVGLEADTRKMKEWLFEAKTGTSILSIGVVGMGGLGKTTVCREVYNNKEVELHFERRLWVSVSQNFTEEQIMRRMLSHLGDVSSGDDCAALLRKINQYLLGKRYLIILDDVWKTDSSWWGKIREGLPKGNGSCIMITTRNGEVASNMGVQEQRIHRPKFLSTENSWLLFRNVAFAESGGQCQSELEGIGMEIVEKCKGLPLAIKAVGGMLCFTQPSYHEWNRIAKDLKDQLAESEKHKNSEMGLMASLQLSYDELPSYLKSCLLCFSVYPEDCVVSKEQLLHWWIGEGFVPLKNDKSAIEAAEVCFYGLTNRCLIEVGDKVYNGTAYNCRIHDSIRDVVIEMAEDDAFFTSDNQSCRHLGISTVDSKNLETNDKLRALISTTKTGEVNVIDSSITKDFGSCRYLRALDLSKTIFRMLYTDPLTQASSLQHLTYLSLSNSHPLIELSPSLEKIHNLQILDLSYCKGLKMVPPFVLNFKKLRVLDVSHCGSLEFLPKGLGRLSNLEVLEGFKPAGQDQAAGCRIGELKNLTRLRRLGVQLASSDEIGENEFNALIYLSELQHLSISCFDCQGKDLVTKIDKLIPPQGLSEMRLKFYPGKTNPVWLNPGSLPMLRYLAICSGNIQKMTESFWATSGAVWKIEGLMFECLSDLEANWSTVQKAMPLLRTVTASWCPELESFPIEEIGFRGGVWKKGESSN